MSADTHPKDLRDEFAIAALAGNLEQGVEDDMHSRDRDSWWHWPDKIARRAYAIADAMLEERSK